MNFVNHFLISNQERIIGLDLLRSLAILWVVYGHGLWILPESYHQIYHKLYLINLDGVSIFFMLSGFLIGGILLKIIHYKDLGRKELFDFWMRRWFRTIPTYFVLLISLWLYYQFIGISIPIRDLLHYFTFTQNFYSSHPDFFPEAWSLAVEEWFYLLFPFLYFLFYQWSKQKDILFLFITLLFILFPLVLRIVKYEPGLAITEFDLEFRKIVLLRLDSIMYGVLAAYLHFKKPAFWEKYKFHFLYVGIAFLILLKVKSGTWVRFYSPLAFNIESIILFCFLPFLSNYKTTKLKIPRCFNHFHQYHFLFYVFAKSAGKRNFCTKTILVFIWEYWTLLDQLFPVLDTNH